MDSIRATLEAARVKFAAPYAYDVSQLLYDAIKAWLPTATKSLEHSLATVTLHMDLKLQGGEFRACTCTAKELETEAASITEPAKE